MRYIEISTITGIFKILAIIYLTNAKNKTFSADFYYETNLPAGDDDGRTGCQNLVRLGRIKTEQKNNCSVKQKNKVFSNVGNTFI